MANPLNVYGLAKDRLVRCWEWVSGPVFGAVAVWLIGPLPLILTNAAFMKLHRVFVASYSVGWLVKLALVAVAVGCFLR